AVVGLRDNENRYLGEDGVWEDQAYVPAYVRRYPFVFVNDQAASRLILCIDEQAAGFQLQVDERPFFQDGKPSTELNNVMRFCGDYQRQYEETVQFGKWLEAEDLLVDRATRAELPDGRVFTLGGLRILNDEKFRALPDDKVLDIHRRGWLPLLHFHLQSQSNWTRLSAKIAAR
ncbi:MAG: SapC family protein, partial [Bradyrhizobium sp.]